MKTNKKTLRAAMDRRLSFLDGLPSCRPALMQRIAQEEVPVMKKRVSFGLVFALVLVSLSVISVAAGLLLSARVSAARLADQALEQTYGVTVEMQTFFAREEEELPDGTIRITYSGAANLVAPLGIYTVNVKDGKAEASWSYDGEDTSGGYEADVWGPEQMKQMIAASQDSKAKEEYFKRVNEIWNARCLPAEEAKASEPDESFEAWHERREAEKNSALDERKLTEEELLGIGREFIITSYHLSDEEIARLELYTILHDPEENRWYETVNGRPCFLVEYLLDHESYTKETMHDENYVRNNAYFKVFVNVETGMIEQYEYDSGYGGVG